MTDVHRHLGRPHRHLGRPSSHLGRPPHPTPVTQHGSTLAQLAAEGAPVVARAAIHLDGVLTDEIPIVAGQVTYDTGRRVWRHCDVTLDGPIPSTPQDTLAPIGSTVHLYRGFRDWTGEIHEQPVGVYAFDDSGVERADRLVQVAGYDFSQVAADARWEAAYEIAGGTNVADAIETALKSRLTDALWQPANFQTTSETTPTIVWGEERNNDPWDDLRTLARDSGMLLYFDRAGRATLTDVPDPDSAPIAADYTAGVSPLLLDVGKTLYGRPANVVVVRGEPDDGTGPVEFVAEDDDSSSASFVGRYRKPTFLTSGYIATEAQAEKAAKAELRRRVGLAEQVDLDVVTDPSLDVWDVIIAKDPELGVDARYIADSMTIPLRPGVASIATRRRNL